MLRALASGVILHLRKRALDVATMASRVTPVTPRDPIPLSEQLRELVRSSGLSMMAVARGAEIDPAALSRFLSGQRGLSMPSLDRLGEFLDVKVTARRRARRAKR